MNNKDNIVERLRDTRSDLHDLEKAEGPCRELDYHIFEAVYDTSNIYFIRSPESKQITHYADRDAKQMTLLPKYTASIDAALTLVPKGWELRELHNYDEKKCWISQPRRLVGTFGFGKTLPNALCLAALRAMGDDDEG